MSYKDVLIGKIGYKSNYSGTDWTEAVGNWTYLYRDHHIFMTSRQIISPPQVDTNIVKVPGSSTVIDLSEVLTGYPTYGPSNIKMTFAIEEPAERFAHRFDECLNEFHGRRLDIIFLDDPGYYYSGRIKVNELESDKRAGSIVIEAECNPYKLEVTQTDEYWLWDPFDFTNGVIREYSEITIDKKTTLEIISCAMPVRPQINTSEPIKLTVKKDTETIISKNLSKGMNELPGLTMRSDGTGKSDKYKFTFEPSKETVISVIFRGGRL